MTIIIVIFKYCCEIVTYSDYGDSDIETRYCSRINAHYDHGNSDFEIEYCFQTFSHCDHGNSEISLDNTVIVEKLSSLLISLLPW